MIIWKSYAAAVWILFRDVARENRRRKREEEECMNYDREWVKLTLSVCSLIVSISISLSTLLSWGEALRCKNVFPAVRQSIECLNSIFRPSRDVPLRQTETHKSFSSFNSVEKFFQLFTLLAPGDLIRLSLLHSSSSLALCSASFAIFMKFN